MVSTLIRRTPLNDAEQERLASYLDQHAVPNDGMSMEMLDGYFHAVVIGPDTIVPSEWLPHIWGAGNAGHDHNWASQDVLNEIFGLMTQHMNSIAAPLRSGVGEWAPLIDEYQLKGKGVSYGQEWALGFLRGVDLRAKQWQPLRDDKAYAGPWIAVGLLAFGPGDPILKARVRRQSQQDRLIEGMLVFVRDAAQYWLERYRPPGPDTPFRAQGRPKRSLPLRKRQKVQTMLRQCGDDSLNQWSRLTTNTRSTAASYPSSASTPS